MSARFVLLLTCTVATFVVIGRAPGAVNLRTREIEMSIISERAPARERGAILAFPGTES